MPKYHRHSPAELRKIEDRIHRYVAENPGCTLLSMEPEICTDFTHRTLRDRVNELVACNRITAVRRKTKDFFYSSCDPAEHFAQSGREISSWEVMCKPWKPGYIHL